MDKKLIIGLGTGRCGTMSLSLLLSRQPDTVVTHERDPHLGWCFDAGALRYKLTQILSDDAAAVGDVAFYYLPYIEAILSRLPAAKFVVLQRSRVQTIRSYQEWVPEHNHWVWHDGTAWQLSHWDYCYPKYEASSREEALGRFWDDYYDTVDGLCRRYPEAIRLFLMDELNSSTGVRRILDFCGLDDPQLTVGIRSNQSQLQPSGRWLESVRGLLAGRFTRRCGRDTIRRRSAVGRAEESFRAGVSGPEPAE